jgi:hypothetical protein
MTEKIVTRREVGTPGHHCLSDRCMFRRHTQLSTPDGDVVSVSTVGLLKMDCQKEFFEVGPNRYFETIVFLKYSPIHHIAFTSPSSISEIPADMSEVDAAHEAVVDEITERMKSGKLEVIS